MTNPTLITTPFAENGDKNDIPEVTGVEPQNATLEKGFPEITQTPISAGGIPPERKDFNGILNLYGQHIVHLNKGLPYEFDAAFATAIGGYPLHARIMLSNGDIVQNTIANNTNNPNSNMTGWVFDGLIKYFSDYVKNNNFPTSSDVSVSVLDGHQTLSSSQNFLIKQRGSVKGNGYAAWLTDANLILDKNSGEITNLYLSRTNPSDYTITFNDSLVQPFFCDIRNIFVRESKGIQVAGAETLLHNIRIVNGNGENRLEKGISVKEKTAGAYSGGDDTSYSHVYIQGCKTGFESTTATAMYDLHVVWADFGVRIGGYDVPNQKPGQKVFFGAYMDKPYNVGIRLSGINGVAFHSPHLFEVGLYADGVSQTEEVCGIRLQGYCYSNFFSAPSFNTTDQSKVYSQILITNNAQNNTFVHANGSYKLDANSLERIRRQNFIAGCDGWARHNNFARLNRANARNVPQGGEVDLVFYLDWEYPAANSNCYLFKGSWVSRQPDTTQLTAFGDMYATVRNGCFGGDSIMTRVSADVGLNWSIVGNPSLSGNQLTVRVKNNGTGTANIAVELQRSVDARGEVF